jgi:hypothetical protein
VRGTIFILSVLFVAGCSSSSAGKQRLTCKSSPDLNGADEIRISPEWRKTSALLAIRDLRQVQKLARTAWFGTGAFSESLGNFAGTDAHNLKAKVHFLQAQVADIKAIDFSLETGGKNPLPSNAVWACKVLAVSVGNLDTGQSDEQFLWAASMLERYLIRSYEGNGGRDLQADLLNLERSGIQK